MIRFIIFISIILNISACAFDYDAPAVKSKKRYSRTIDRKFRNAGDGFARKVKPSESMQAGIPKSKGSANFVASDYAGYNSNYRNYNLRGTTAVRDEYGDNFSSNNLASDSGFKTVDDIDDGGNDNFDSNNILSSGVYTGHFKIGQPYTAFGVSYTPQDYESYEEIGTASWYGSEFNGKKTANGEIYNMGDLTAAHPTLPLPSLIRVTNLQNGKTQILRVNDRGPFAKNRVIDVSEKAAEVLGFKGKGTTQVKVELLREDTDLLLEKLRIKN